MLTEDEATQIAIMLLKQKEAGAQVISRAWPTDKTGKWQVMIMPSISFTQLERVQQRGNEDILTASIKDQTHKEAAVAFKTVVGREPAEGELEIGKPIERIDKPMEL
ncbi:MAG: hypothetical protein KGJ06_05615 [Pseudomonadota bacterium]|nr:hypothetical protein [Pseudomonadota bacterium]